MTPTSPNRDGLDEVERKLAAARERFLDAMGETVDLSHLDKDDGTADEFEREYREGSRP